jgi:steroid 5-alpha reductase family enzyme
MKNKAASLWIILAIYVIAFGAGALCLAALVSVCGALPALFIADAAATVVVFIANLIFHNASTYDPYWSVQPPVIAAACYAFLGADFNPVQLFLLVPLLIWAVRLTVNWAIGFDNLEWQDWRYTSYEKQYPKIYQLIVFVGIMFMPTCLVFLGCVPLVFMLAAANPAPLFPALGGIIILLGTCLEISADWSMREYKKEADRGPYIFRGLWKYLRHPNYLGEMLVWVGVFIGSLENFNLQNAGGCILIILLFIFVSIPMMEKHMLGKSPAYAEYRKRVRVFI